MKVGVILLILLILLGTGGYFAFHFITSRGGNTANTGVNSETTPTQAPRTTTPINTTVSYASVNITIINAQQAILGEGEIAIVTSRYEPALQPSILIQIRDTGVGIAEDDLGFQLCQLPRAHRLDAALRPDRHISRSLDHPVPRG